MGVMELRRRMVSVRKSSAPLSLYVGTYTDAGQQGG
ncbi:MAG: hypothetical protein JWM95_4112, partial [Gemmatimonadetes bacterium]|nr:hypothetical protein [Gemmatimonadota bacterium]